MLSLGPLAFANAWLLSALIALPLLWWLLRVTPPAPRRLSFPAVRLLFGLEPPEETPARTPLWLVLLRMLIVALIILGLAQPILNPSARLDGDGPVVLVVDDGWAAARNWPARERLLASLLDQADRQKQPVALVTSAPDPRERATGPLELRDAQQVRRLTQGLAPKPWPTDRAALAERLGDSKLPRAGQIFWLSDGLDDGAGRLLAERLQRLGRLTVYRDDAPDLPRLLLPPESQGLSLTLRLTRALAGEEDRVVVRSSGEDGRLIAQSELRFAADSSEAQAEVTLPIELRNRITQLSIENEAGAGAVLLLDERWRRRPVGLVSGSPLESAQPLLSDLYYLERALEPFTEISSGQILELLQRELAIIVLADVGALLPEQLQPLEAWVERGGLLLRFAGPRLAEADDELLPVRLRRGGRTLGGALTWDTPARLAAFPSSSPLSGLAIPGDVTVNRQVLAEPSLELGERTWARLSDGTPLITAEQRGEGWVVLIHTTANVDWSNLSLSGLFVEILQRVVAISEGVGGAGATESLRPIQVLDGFGRLGPPPPTVLDLDAETLESGSVSPLHPPGIYGAEGVRRALNLATAESRLQPLPQLPAAVSQGGYAASDELDLRPWLLAAALLLGLADLVIALFLRGLLGPAARQATPLVLLATATLLLLPDPASAQEGRDVRALAATLETRFAYVLTGVPAVDDITRAGLQGLGRVLTRRTAVEPGKPMGVRLGRDELAFFPLLYWAITPEQRDLDERARQAFNGYLRDGGTVLMDLREPGSRAALFGQSSRGVDALRRLTRDLEIPQLVPVPPDHVLTKSFYLMQDFPGRFVGGTLWIEAPDETDNDGVASVLIGANDWAGAWAVADFGRPLLAVVPGGERQREMAFRFGVNLVMYALTGNYKADQVHVPFILERLGQ